MSELTMKQYQEQAHTTAMYPDLTQLFLSAFEVEMNNKTCSSMRNGFRQGELRAYVESNLKRLDSHIPNPYYPALGLSGEVGELCNKLKKVMRDKGGEITPEFLEDAKKEIGDILWYVSELAFSLGLDLEEIAEKNLEKLKNRKEKGTIKGSGDNR